MRPDKLRLKSPSHVPPSYSALLEKQFFDWPIASAWAIDDWGLFYYSTSNMIAHDDARSISALSICTNVRGGPVTFHTTYRIAFNRMSHETPKMSEIGPKVLLMPSYKLLFHM